MLKKFDKTRGLSYKPPNDGTMGAPHWQEVKAMKKAIEIIGALALFGGLSYGLMAAAFGGPVVYVSHETGECVAWEDADGQHSCDTKPANAERVWIR